MCKNKRRCTLHAKGQARPLRDERRALLVAAAVRLPRRLGPLEHLHRLLLHGHVRRRGRDDADEQRANTFWPFFSSANFAAASVTASAATQSRRRIVCRSGLLCRVPRRRARRRGFGRAAATARPVIQGFCETTLRRVGSLNAYPRARVRTLETTKRRAWRASALSRVRSQAWNFH